MLSEGKELQPLSLSRMSAATAHKGSKSLQPVTKGHPSLMVADACLELANAT